MMVEICIVMLGLLVSIYLCGGDGFFLGWGGVFFLGFKVGLWLILWKNFRMFFFLVNLRLDLLLLGGVDSDEIDERFEELLLVILLSVNVIVG